MGAQTLAVTTANVDPDTTTAWMKLDLATQDKAFSVAFTSNASSGSAIIVAGLRKSDGTFERAYAATATPTVYRVGADGASGEYVCAVVFNASGNEWVDATGFVKPETRDKTLTPSPGGGKEWYVGCHTFTTIASGTLTVVPVTEI